MIPAPGLANSCMAGGHSTAHKAAWLSAGTSENGPVYLDQRPASVIICERQEDEEEEEGEEEEEYFILCALSHGEAEDYFS